MVMWEHPEGALTLPDFPPDFWQAYCNEKFQWHLSEPLKFLIAVNLPEIWGKIWQCESALRVLLHYHICYQTSGRFTAMRNLHGSDQCHVDFLNAIKPTRIWSRICQCGRTIRLRSHCRIFPQISGRFTAMRNFYGSDKCHWIFSLQ